MQIDGVDIGQTIMLAPLVWAIINIWKASRSRDQTLKDNAVENAIWRKDMEHKVELLKTQGCKDTTGISKQLKEFRDEVKEDHVETKREIAKLREEIKQVEKTGREGRDKIYEKIEKIRR